jgi:hypothetical protein
MLDTILSLVARLRHGNVLRALVVVSLALCMPSIAAAHDPERGPIVGRGATYRGLTLMTHGRCAGAFRIDNTGFCTHGPDVRSGLRPARAAGAGSPSAKNAAGAATGTAVTCDGDGVSGDRVQAIYAHGPSTTSRYATLLPSLQTYAADIEAVFLQSAAETGGIRRPRWVTDSECRLSVVEVSLSAAAESSFNTTISELSALGYNHPDRKYLVWFDANVYCGIGTWWGDDRPTADNLSNTTTGYARTDASCWDWAESHELMHNLGGVQNSAPNSSAHRGGFGHCTDEYDLMCYVDNTGVTMDFVCPASHDPLFDCEHNDYFDTSPAGGSYLATYWNAANSGWLAHTQVDLIAPQLRLLADRVVDATGVLTGVTFATGAPVAGLESVGVARQQDAGAWTTVSGVGATATAVSSRLAGSHTFRFRAGATGDDGNPGDWTTGAATRVSIRQEGIGAIHYQGGWHVVSDATALGGKTRWSAKAGATATITTGATDVALVGSRGPNRGIAEVFVDGTRVATIDLYASSLQARRTIWVRHFATPGSHTVRFRVTGTHAAASDGSRVDLDGLVRMAPAT